MIPVGNSGPLPVRSAAGGAKNGALGWGLSQSEISSREMLTYAHIGAAGFHADKTAGGSAAAAGSASVDGAVGRNAFQELLNANAAALAAAQAPAQTSRAPAGVVGPAEKKQPTWSVSMEGGRIQLSVNAIAR